MSHVSNPVPALSVTAAALSAGQYVVVAFVFLVSAVLGVIARRATAGERG